MSRVAGESCALSYDDYVAYLRSPAWQELRDRARAIAPYPGCAECARRGYDYCLSDVAFEVHHLTYERVGHELLEDLEVLCWPHHLDAHTGWDPFA